MRTTSTIGIGEIGYVPTNTLHVLPTWGGRMRILRDIPVRVDPTSDAAMKIKRVDYSAEDGDPWNIAFEVVLPEGGSKEVGTPLDPGDWYAGRARRVERID